MTSRLAALLVVGALAVPGASSAQSGPVLVVGDSLEVGTGPHLRRELGSVKLTIDARTGRPSTEGLRVLRERLQPGHKVVVFDLGTNDDPSRTTAFGRTLAAARDAARGRCLVVSTLNRPPLAGVSVDGMNETVRNFVDATPRAVLVDWQAAVGSEPSLLAADRIHATPGGYVTRAQLVASAIEQCSSDGGRRAARRPAREELEPEPGPRPRKGHSKVVRRWSGLLGVLPWEAVVGYARGVVDLVVAAAQSVVSVFGRQPPEIELGAPGSEP